MLVKYRNRTNWRALNLPRNINENTDMQASAPAYQMNKLMETMGKGTYLLRILAIVIVFVSALSVFISLFSALKDRKYELALLRVMGGSRFQIFLLILMEGILLALIGSLLGLVLSHVGMEAFAGYMESQYRYQFDGLRWLLEENYLLIGALIIGILAAIIPAIQASRADISNTLSNVV